MEKQQIYFDQVHSPLGSIVIAASSHGLHHLFFEERGRLEEGWQYSPERLQEVTQQLAEYFKGKRKQFDLLLAPTGTAFQMRVWQELCRIPYGKTISYKEMAHRIDKPKAYRAVGGANGKNPISIIQPCHRVIAADGSLGGFSSGLERKEFLLQLEGQDNKKPCS
ncbi:methylated-DNA--[protein]-cysteine S-methyltransferase [Desulfotalea psychrophila]|uniref:Methylated-DNA--protein-cysteine methyltransferase n=1 Tax=Desulfotalea psychrophila (strain LSv54 / DSM 12343) TaxID=177439 RepID=Q6APS5_DESPS|nr:methylated-DNA--[protein]-cysteine S-methyltransferase [Desulfotalea psychrophila]CAG35649.1 probable methylated-DNA-protein-cysteine methyltransferase [Desulfotalea psychrophila LSv54]